MLDNFFQWVILYVLNFYTPFSVQDAMYIPQFYSAVTHYHFEHIYYFTLVLFYQTCMLVVKYHVIISFAESVNVNRARYEC